MHLVGLSHICVSRCTVQRTLSLYLDRRIFPRSQIVPHVGFHVKWGFLCPVLTNIGMLRQMVIRTPNMKPCDRPSGVGSHCAMRANKPTVWHEKADSPSTPLLCKTPKTLKGSPDLKRNLIVYLSSKGTFWNTRAPESLLLQGTCRLLVL